MLLWLLRSIAKPPHALLWLLLILLKALILFEVYYFLTESSTGKVVTIPGIGSQKVPKKETPASIYAKPDLTNECHTNIAGISSKGHILFHGNREAHENGTSWWIQYVSSIAALHNF